MNTNKIMNWRPGDFQRTPHLRRVLFFGRNWDISAIFSEYTETNLLAFYTQIWWNSIENDITEKHFIYVQNWRPESVFRMSPLVYVTSEVLEHHWDVSLELTRKCRTPSSGLPSVTPRTLCENTFWRY